MKVTEKLNMDYEELCKNGPITIVVFGDSITHGAVAPGELNYETVYWNRLKNKLHDVRNYVPINVINAGIGGITASGSLERMELQVLRHNPDLIIVCFGLNDVNGTLDDYISALRTIFEKGKNSGADMIFMTPNMLNTYVADDVIETHRNYAVKTAQMQNDGKMDLFMDSAVKLANDMDITVCDCYAKWKEIAKTQDTTILLANRINHPVREMHELFAQSLFDVIMAGNNAVASENESTMYRDN